MNNKIYFIILILLFNIISGYFYDNDFNITKSRIELLDISKPNAETILEKIKEDIRNNVSNVKVDINYNEKSNSINIHYIISGNNYNFINNILIKYIRQELGLKVDNEMRQKTNINVYQNGRQYSFLNSINMYVSLSLLIWILFTLDYKRTKDNFVIVKKIFNTPLNKRESVLIMFGFIAIVILALPPVKLLFKKDISLLTLILFVVIFIGVLLKIKRIIEGK